jgi:hypothetical protein
MLLNPETLKTMKEAAEKALSVDVPATPYKLKREAFFDFQLSATPANVSALIVEVERQAHSCPHCNCVCVDCVNCSSEVENMVTASTCD